MKNRRMHKSGCSMLAAALVGLLPIAAINAQDTGSGFSDEESSQQQLRGMDEVRPQGPEGTLREGDDSDPTLRSDDTDTDIDSGAEGPLRDESDFDSGDMGGTEGPSGFEADEDAMEDDDIGDSDMETDAGAAGPSRFDTEMSDTTGTEGPRRDTDMLYEEGSSSSTGPRARQWQDEATMERQQQLDSGVRGPLRDDTEPADPNLFDESPALRDDARMDRDFDADMGAEGRLRQERDMDEAVSPDASGSRAPMRQEPQTLDSEPAAQGPARKDIAPHKGEVLGAEAPARSYTAPATHYRTYVGESNEFIDPGGVQLMPYAPSGVLGPARTEMPQFFRSYVFEANEYIDPGSVQLVPMAELGARGPLREADEWTHHFHQYNGESNPLLDLSWGYFGNADLPSVGR